MDLISVVPAVRPVDRGVRYLSFCGARVFWASGGSVAGEALGIVVGGVRVLFLFDEGRRCGGRSVDRDMYPLRAFLDSAGGIVRLWVLHC